MKKYHIKILKRSLQDIDELIEFISETYKAPLTARKYAEGILSTIQSLNKYAESIPVSTRKTIVEKYGNNVRRINYKKHAIIYNVQGDTIVIQRIIVGSLIK
jgi:plasmid stabilization system protein ParE